MADTTTFTFAQITDVHLPPLPQFPLRYWNTKRILGYLNWHRRRKFAHQLDVLQRLVDDLLSQTHDHVVVTGDLVNIALPEEFRNALSFLKSLGTPDRVTVIPGNHDIYLETNEGEGADLWRDYMSAKDYAMGGGQETLGLTFPFVRTFGNVALVGCNSAYPTPPLVAAGRLGNEQRAALAEILADLKQRGFVRVVLIHHPPLPGQAPERCGLQDANALAEVLKTQGAELVLHGHNHSNMFETLKDVEGGDVSVIGTASCSSGIAKNHRNFGRYNLFDVRSESQSVTINMLGRGLASANGPVVDLEQKTFSYKIP